VFSGTPVKLRGESGGGVPGREKEVKVRGGKWKGRRKEIH